MNGLVPHIAKRPRTVIQQILEHGFVTTEELKKLGYVHAPRAARDVRELGIPLETFRVKDSNGRLIAAYRFGDPKKAEDRLSKIAGRTVLSAALKKAPIKKYGSKCFIYLQPMEERLLQVDHRIPYEIGEEFMWDCFELLQVTVMFMCRQTGNLWFKLIQKVGKGKVNVTF